MRWIGDVIDRGVVVGVSIDPGKQGRTRYCTVAGSLSDKEKKASTRDGTRTFSSIALCSTIQDWSSVHCIHYGLYHSRQKFRCAAATLVSLNSESPPTKAKDKV